MIRKPHRTLRFTVMLVSCFLFQALFTTIGCANSSLQSEALLKRDYEQLIRNERVDIPVSEAGSAAAAGERKVYLTFDDGPSKHTENILDILAAEQIPATFFVLGERVERAPETVRRIIDEGHVLGNHSFNHQYKELYSSFDGYWEQLLQTEAVIQEQTLTVPRLIRAPGGTYTNFDAFYYQFLSTAGYTVVDWNVDSGDSRRKGVTAQEIVDNVKASVLHERAVVLLHDGPGHGSTVEALPEIIAYYRAQGYTFDVLDSTHSKPVQFRLGPSKWEREVFTYSQYKQWMRTVSDHYDDMPDQADQGPFRTSSISTDIPSQGLEKPNAHSSNNEAQEGSPALQLTVNGVNLRLESGEYRFERDRFAVPFSFVAEHLASGRSENNETSGRLQLQTFNRLAVFEPGAQLITVEGVKGLKQHYVSDVFVEDGEVYVGLRMAAEWLGYEVTSFTIGGDEHHVTLQKNIISLPLEV